MHPATIFHQLHHVCIVVRDIEASVAYYESIGVGPWHEYPSLDQYELKVKDPRGYLRLRYRYANLANFQLQLCQPSESDTPQWRFLQDRGQGVFHLGFTVPDVDAAERQGLDLGLGLISRGRLPDGTGFTYFDTAGRGASVTLEVRRSELC